MVPELPLTTARQFAEVTEDAIAAGLGPGPDLSGYDLRPPSEEPPRRPSCCSLAAELHVARLRLTSTAKVSYAGCSTLRVRPGGSGGVVRWRTMRSAVATALLTRLLT